METVVAPKNPYAKLAVRFGDELAMRSAQVDEVAQIIGDRPYIATLKMDGHLAVLHVNIDAGFAQVYNRTDKVRWGFPAAEEAQRCLARADVRDCIAFAELYATDAQGKPLRLNAANAILNRKHPTPEQVARLHLAVFDLYRVDGEVLWDRMTYPDRFALIFTLFQGCTMVHPVAGQPMGAEGPALESLWRRHILDENYEGLVLRANGTVKVKPVHAIDVAVIGYKMGSGRNLGTVGSLAVALRNASGRYVYAGLVGSGLRDVDRAHWTKRLRGTTTTQQVKWAAGGIRLVAPQFVIEVAAEAITKKVQPSLFWDADRATWDLGGPTQAGAAFRSPRYQRWREDKDAQHTHDVRLSQVPGWEQGAAAQVEAFVRRIGVPEDRVVDVVRDALQVQGTVDQQIQMAQTLADEWQRTESQFRWEDVEIPEPDDAEFEDLLGQSIPLLERFLRGKLNAKPQDASDAASEAATKAVLAYRGHLGSRPTPGLPLLPWLYTIASNTLKDIWKRGGERKREWETRAFGGMMVDPVTGLERFVPGVMERESVGRQFRRNP